MKSEAQSPPSTADTGSARLLYSRRQVAELLGGVDISYIRRLEKAGRLKPVRLTRSPSAMAFYRAQDVAALVEEAADVQD
jgi:hypothetical protein